MIKKLLFFPLLITSLLITSAFLFLGGCGENRFKKYETSSNSDYKNFDPEVTDTSREFTLDKRVSEDSSSTFSSNRYSSFESSLAVREAEDEVLKAYKIKEFNQAVNEMQQNNPEKASELLKKALSRDSSNTFIKVKMKHADLMIHRKRADSNRALNEALSISGYNDRSNETLSFIEEAVKSDPQNPIIKKQANELKFEIFKKSNPEQAKEARYKIIDAQMLLERIRRDSTHFTHEYRRK
jgi:hypothetical protein